MSGPRRLIYPVEVKPKSNIGSWDSWPKDVVETLRRWNHGHLTFTRGRVFKCVDCAAFCEAHTHGAAVLDGAWLCDDCLIARVRNGHEVSL